MTPPSDPESAEISIEKIYGKLDLIFDKMDSILKILDDHESRMRATETKVNSLLEQSAGAKEAKAPYVEIIKYTLCVIIGALVTFLMTKAGLS